MYRRLVMQVAALYRVHRHACRGCVYHGAHGTSETAFNKDQLQ
ncbi:MAG: hypothetical protein QHH75_13620 [Bacillota bacterium]|nr:hypothetical protein [Bacillota bacterium]